MPIMAVVQASWAEAPAQSAVIRTMTRPMSKPLRAIWSLEMSQNVEMRERELSVRFLATDGSQRREDAIYIEICSCVREKQLDASIFGFHFLYVRWPTTLNCSW